MSEYNELLNQVKNRISDLEKENERLRELTRYQQEYSVSGKTIGQLTNSEYIEFIKVLLWKISDLQEENKELKEEVLKKQLL